MNERLYSLSRVGCADRDSNSMDTVARSRTMGNRRAFDILLEAQSYWGAMSRFRRERERNKRYTYGDQWGDVITVDGKTMTEEQYIVEQGSIPLKNNQIRRLVTSVLGVYRSQAKEPTCIARDRQEQKLGEVMTVALQYNMDLNRMDEVLARTMQEFLISGFAVHRLWYGYRNDKLDCWTDYVQPNNFFMDSNMRDFRGWDVSMLGEVHDVSFGELVGQFATSHEDYERLEEIYRNAADRELMGRMMNEFGYSRPENYDFLFSSEPGRCRVIEVWRKEQKPRWRCHDWNSGDVYKIEMSDYAEMVEAVNADRLRRGAEAGMDSADIPLIEAEWFIDNYWYYYYLSPFGDILAEGETPYEHRSHPYVFAAYPFIDGEVHSFVGDVIDQQRYTNRLITLYDWIMRASAKGVLMFPEDSLPDNMSIEEIADEWTRFNGMIFYKAKAGISAPQQVSANSTQIGINELLNLQLKFFEDISGVSGALQGKAGFSGMSAALYNQQTQNATTSLLDLLESFGAFSRDVAMKTVKNIQQFYDDNRVLNISGKTLVYDPQRIKDTEFDLSIMESTQTPVYRQLANEILMELWRAQAITVEQLLQNGTFPFADDLLQSIATQKQEMAEQQAAMEAQQGQVGNEELGVMS